MKTFEQYNRKKPRFNIGDKVYATNIGNFNLSPDIEYTVDEIRLDYDSIYIQLEEKTKPNWFNEIRFSTPVEYSQMKFNI